MFRRLTSFDFRILALMAAALLCSGTECPQSDNGNGQDNGQDNTQVNDNSSGGDGSASLLREFSLPTPLFSPDSAWRQRADGAEVLTDSDERLQTAYRVLLGDTSTLQPPENDVLWPFVVVNYDDYTIPIFLAGDEEADVRLEDYDGAAQWPGPAFTAEEIGGPLSLPAPAGIIRPSGPQDIGADGHVVLFDQENLMAYDLYAVTTAVDAMGNSLGGGYAGDVILAAGAVDAFELSGDGTNPDGFSSCRAVGTALLGGLLLPEDVENGVIEHALAFAIPGPRNLAADPFEPLTSDYFYPASTTETDFYNTDPQALASGERIRLKGSLVDEEGTPIDEDDLAPITQMFLTALRDYGAYLVDNAGGFTFYAEDIASAALSLSDAEVNVLIGEAAGTPLPAGRTRWQVLMEKLNQDLELIPLGSGAWWEYEAGAEDPATATFGISNFEVVDPATEP